MSTPEKRNLAGHLNPESLDVAQRLLFIGLSESDFVQASTAAKTALALVGDPTWEPCPTYLALSEAALIRYSRPFMGNRMPGTKKKAALPLSYLPFEIDGAEAFHQVAMAIRHQFGAHSDMTKRDLWLEKLLAPEFGVVWRGHALCAWLKPPDLYGLHRLANAMASALRQELSMLAEEAFPGIPGGAKLHVSTTSRTSARTF